jgi:hypothetical protein
MKLLENASTRVKSGTWIQVDKFHHKKPNQLIYD